MKNQKLKKIIGIAMTSTMLVSNVPMGLYAEENEKTVTETSIKKETEQSAAEETKSETEKTTETIITTEKKAETESETAKDTKTESETSKDTETESETAKDTETEAKDAETETETVKNAETDAETAKDVETETETVKNAETEAETKENPVTELETAKQVEDVSVEERPLTSGPDIKEDISVDIETASFIYDGNPHVPTVSVKVGDETLATDDYNITYFYMDGNGIKITVAESEIKDAKAYGLEINGKGTYKDVNETKENAFKIEPADINSEDVEVTLNSDKNTFVYDGQEQKPEVTVKFKGTELTEDTESTNGDYTISGQRDVGTYKVSITGTGNFTGEKITEHEFKIEPADINSSDIEITVNPDTNTFVYNGQEQKPGVTVKFKGTDLTEATEDTKGDYKISGQKDAGEYEVLSITGSGNFTGEKEIKTKFTIEQLNIENLGIEIESTVYNGGEQEAIFTAKGDDGEKVALEECLPDGMSVLKIDGEGITQDVDGKIKAKNANNYRINISVNDGNYTGSVTCDFTINPRPVTIEVLTTSKNFGSEDKKLYDVFDGTMNDEGEVTGNSPAWNAEASNKKGVDEILSVTREEGEEPDKEYRMTLNCKDDTLENFTCTVVKDGETIENVNDLIFEIVQKYVTFDIEKSSIDSRDKSFGSYTADGILGEDSDNNVINGYSLRLKYKAHLPESGTADITFNADEAVANLFDIAVSDSGDLNIDPIKYSKDGKTWTGYLPAGTEIETWVEATVDGEKWYPVSNSVALSVDKHAMTLDYDASKTTQPCSCVSEQAHAKYCVPDEHGTITFAVKGDEGEVLNVTTKDAEYDQKNTITVTATGDDKHVHGFKVDVLDKLNLNSNVLEMNDITIDSRAETNVTATYKNRDQSVIINLPEEGTIMTCDILGASASMDGSVHGMNNLELDISGITRKNPDNLVHSSTPVRVTYKDVHGHEYTKDAAGTAEKSTVHEISFSIQPQPESGYLQGDNGNIKNAIIAGTGTGAEKIILRIGDETHEVTASAGSEWSENQLGDWTYSLDVSTLPEHKDIVISAEYDDVIGSGHSVTVKYDAYVADPAILSPIFESMQAISGMAELDTAVAMAVKGEYYKVERDSFGHFIVPDLPLLSAGDTIEIYVADVYGNTSITVITVPEMNEEETIDTTIQPLGKFFYDAQKKGSMGAMATPVSMEDFEEDETSIEVPMLLGATYEVGTMTLTKTEEGVIATKELLLDEYDADYTVENENLYVYTEQPTISAIVENKGKAYKYGDVIPVKEDQTIWVVDDTEVTIYTEDVEDLDVFEFSDSSDTLYAKYQNR